jgi:hypothetical protein
MATWAKGGSVPIGASSAQGGDPLTITREANQNNDFLSLQVTVSAEKASGSVRFVVGDQNAEVEPQDLAVENITGMRLHIRFDNAPTGDDPSSAYLSSVNTGIEIRGAGRLAELVLPGGVNEATYDLPDDWVLADLQDGFLIHQYLFVNLSHTANMANDGPKSFGIYGVEVLYDYTPIDNSSLGTPFHNDLLGVEGEITVVNGTQVTIITPPGGWYPKVGQEFNVYYSGGALADTFTVQSISAGSGTSGEFTFIVDSSNLYGISRNPTRWLWFSDAAPPAPSGSGHISATATLSGSGSIVAPSFSGSGSISATTSLSGSGFQLSSGSGLLTATVALTGNGSQLSSGSGSLAATSSLSGSGELVTPSFSGSGSLSAAASLIGSGEVVAPIFAGTGSLTATVVLAGDGLLVGPSFSGTGLLSASVSLEGDGVLVTPIFSGTGSLTATTTLVGNGSVAIPGFSGTGSLSAVGSLSGDGTLVTPNFSGTGSFVATTTLQGSGSAVSPIFAGTGSLLATTTLDGTGALVVPSFSGTGSISVTVTLYGTGSLPAAAYVWDGTKWADGVLKVYNGVAWVTPKVWDGVSWQSF